MPRSISNPAFEAHRSGLNASLLPLDPAWELVWEDIRHLPILPGHSLGDDKVIVSADMVPPVRSAESNRTIDYLKALPEGWSREEERSEMALRRLKRIAFLDLTQTVIGEKWRLKPPRPQTWVLKTQRMISAAKLALLMDNRQPAAASACPDGQPIFQNLTPEAFDELRLSHPTFFHTGVARLNGLFRAGRMDDWPIGDVAGFRLRATQYGRSATQPSPRSSVPASSWRGSRMICRRAFKKSRRSRKIRTVVVVLPMYVALEPGGSRSGADAYCISDLYSHSSSELCARKDQEFSTPGL